MRSRFVLFVVVALAFCGSMAPMAEATKQGPSPADGTQQVNSTGTGPAPAQNQTQNQTQQLPDLRSYVPPPFSLQEKYKLSITYQPTVPPRRYARGFFSRGIPRPPKPDENRILPYPCDQCAKFAHRVAFQALKEKVTRTDALINYAQSFCWRKKSYRMIGVSCGDYEKMYDFLIKGRMVQPPQVFGRQIFKDMIDEHSVYIHTVDAKMLRRVARNPFPFCYRNLLCTYPFNTRRNRRSFAPRAHQFRHADAKGSVVVRFRLDRRLMRKKDLPSFSSPLWKRFVTTFLRATAAALDIPEHRLQLHLHRDPLLMQVVIKPNRRTVVMNPNWNWKQRNREFQRWNEPPLSVGNRFKTLLTNTTDLDPNSPLRLVDARFEVQVRWAPFQLPRPVRLRKMRRLVRQHISQVEQQSQPVAQSTQRTNYIIRRIPQTGPVAIIPLPTPARL